MLDVFSSKQNINLVLEFLDTDLEAVIRDKALIFQTRGYKVMDGNVFERLGILS